jgi:hypothetical protein
MISLNAATVLLQWAVAGLLFLWVTTRRRELGIGYGWLLRGVYGVMAVGAFAAGRVTGGHAVRDTCSLLVAVAASVSLGVSIARRKAGVAKQRQTEERRSARVAAMTGIDRAAVTRDLSGPEFPPWIDLLAPLVGVVGLVAAAVADAGSHGPVGLAIVRTLIGAAFLGSVTDAMLLGHWYLVQPGLGRAPLNELVRWVAYLWPFEVAAMLWPTGMVQVINGHINDGYGGMLGWFWMACAAATIILTIVTMAALKERAYSAVMAATGLLYLAILTGFGTDLVARAILAG